MSTKKLDEGEINALKNIGEKYAQITATLGQLKVREILLKNETSHVEKMYEDTINTERALQDELFKKYGDGSIDIDKGEFISQ